LTTIFHAKSYVAKAGKPPRGAPRRKVTNTYKRLSALSKVMGNAVKVDLVKGVTTFKSRVSDEALMEAWKKGDYHKLLTHIPFDKLPGDLAPAIKAIGQGIETAADYQLEAMPPNINANLRFDVSNPRTRTFLETRTASMVTRIETDTRMTIQGEITRAFTHAQTPRQVAERIKSSIGLIPAHETALDNYRASLEEAGDLSPDRIAELTDAYEARLLDYRAMNIARTETRMAVNHGQLAVWQAGADQGFIDRETAKKEWIVDGAPCAVCEPMDGIRVGLDEPWLVTYTNGQVQSVYIPTESHPHCMCGMELHFGETEGVE
jgi:hypothetical protein